MNHLTTAPPQSGTTVLLSRDRLPDPRASLSAVQPFAFALRDVRAFLHDFFRFGEDEFDVAWVGHVGVDLPKSRLSAHTFYHSSSPQFNSAIINLRGETYTTVSTIRPTSLLRRLVHLDMLHDQISRIQALRIGVGFRVLEEAEEEFGGFDRPARFRDAELFA